MAMKHNGKRKNRKHKIISANHQLDVLNEVIVTNGISKYDVDLDAIFDPLAPLKTNKNNLLRVIGEMQRENESVLRQSVKFLVLPSLFVFNSFLMYFTVLW